MQRSLDIVLEIFILLDFSLGVSSDSQTDEGIFHTVVGHQFPVNLLLIFRHVNPLAGNPLTVVIIVHDLIVVLDKLLQIVCMPCQIIGYGKKVILPRICHHNLIRIEIAEHGKRPVAVQHQFF